MMNENHIKKLEIKNFKSIKEMELDCSRINVFIGKPNVGKSNILEALGLLGAGFSTNTNKYLSDIVRYNSIMNLFYDNDIDKKIKVNITKYNKKSSSFWLSFNQKLSGYKLYYGDSQKLSSGITESIEYKNIGETPNHFIIIESHGKITGSPANLKLTKKYSFKHNAPDSYPTKSYLLPPYGKNLISIMESNKKFRDEVAQLFTPYGHEIVLDFQEKKFEIQKRIDNISYKTDYNLIADTLQRIIFHYAAIYSNKDSVLLFEEPENHSYPPYIRSLAEKIIDDENGNQYFLTTHSPFILNTLMEKTKSEDLSVFIVYYENHETKYYKLTEENMSEALDYGVDIFYNLNWYVND